MGPNRRSGPVGTCPSSAPGSPRFPGSRRRLAVLPLLLALLAAGCVDGPDRSSEFFRTPSPHEAQRLEIRERGLDGTALGSQWLREAERALERPLSVRSPYVEAGRFVRPEADAVGYRIGVERGQRLEIRIGGELMGSGDLLVDLFRVAPGETGRRAWIRSLPGGAGLVDLEPDRAAEYVLRLQPALFAEGAYELRIRTVSALDFPVLGYDNSAVWSGFGAPREGGRRSHHGVDIFAPRGTPVVAATAAEVRRVDDTPVGGKVVWLRDRRRQQSLYYAHLDSQTVREGQWVSPGDTVGMVGNSGNARTTPTHLHFGLYARGRGPIDPLPFIRTGAPEPSAIVADVERSGSWSRARTTAVRLRSTPTLRGDVLAELGPDRPFRVVAATREWYRVRLADGTEGYVAARVTESAGDVERIAGGAVGEAHSPSTAGAAPADAARTSDRLEGLR